MAGAPPPAAGHLVTGASSRPVGAHSRRQFVGMLLLGAVGAGLALLAVRQGWARAVYTEPKPLPSQSITVTGQDMVPAAGALALAGLACLAAIIATRGRLRQVAGAVLALCGVGVVITASGSLSAARVIAAASSKVSSSSSVASGGSGSTTGGVTSGSSAGAVVTGDSSVHTVLLGVPWRVALFAGAAAIIVAGLLTVWRGTRWPVMSGRYDRQPAPQASAGSAAAPVIPASQLDQAALWDSITRGDDPTLGPDPANPGEATDLDEVTEPAATSEAADRTDAAGPTSAAGPTKTAGTTGNPGGRTAR